MANDLTVERLREVLSYDPVTGIFRWRNKPVRQRIEAGAIAGCANSKGRYVGIKIEGRIHAAHRLAWAHFYGAWPRGVVDHRDGNGKNNSIENLRQASVSQNGANTKRWSNNKSGYKGVSLTKGGKYIAQLRVNGRRAHVSTHDTPEAAYAAYCAAAAAHNGEFARVG